MKQHRCIGGALSLFRVTYMKPRDLSCVNDNLSKNSMRDWFHPNGKLKDTYKRCVEFDTYFTKFTKHCPMLEFHSALKEKIYTVLKKMRMTEQPLYAVCIQQLFK